MTETQVLVINADLPDIDHPLAIGPKPEMFKLAQHNYKSGVWPFPVRLVRPGAKVQSDAAYLASMKLDPKQGEREDIKAIRQARKHGKHSLRQIAESTAIEFKRVGHERCYLENLGIQRVSQGNDVSSRECVGLVDECLCAF